MTVLFAVGSSKEQPRESKSLKIVKTCIYNVWLSGRFVDFVGKCYFGHFCRRIVLQLWLLVDMLRRLLRRVLAMAMNTPSAPAPKAFSWSGIPTQSALFTSIEDITTGLEKTIWLALHPGALCVHDLPVIVFASGWPHTNWCMLLNQQQWRLSHASLVLALTLHIVVSHRLLCQTAWLDPTIL